MPQAYGAGPPIPPSYPRPMATASAVASSGNIGPGFDVVALALDLRCVAQPHPSLTNQVESGISQRNILLEDRRLAAPLADTVAKNKSVVAHAAEKFEKWIHL